MELSIIIPCYNEEGNLPSLIEKCKMVVKANSLVEIVLVNNGSVDHSQRVLDHLLASSDNQNIRSHHVEVNQGYGFGIMEGLKQASADILCWTHADLQTDIFDCLKALLLFKKESMHYTLIKGNRQGRNFFDTMFTSLMSYYVFFKLREFVTDINAQPKLFSRKLYEEVKKNAPTDFSLDLYFLLYAKKKGTIIEFPVDFSQRMAGKAKGGSGSLKLKLKLANRTLKFINTFSSKI